MARKIGVRPVRMLVAGAVLFCPGALVGCGESQEPTDTKATPAATKAPAAAVVPTELTGSWTRTFTRAEVARGGNWHGSPGEYTIKFARDGSVGIYYPKADVANDCTSEFDCYVSEVKATGGTLSIGETTLCTGTGKYSFTIAGGALTTEKLEEDCTSDRLTFFDGNTWRRAS